MALGRNWAVVLCGMTSLVALTHGVAAQPVAKPVPAASAPATDDIVGKIAIAYEKFVLPNGLTVLLHADHSQPKVMVSVTYRVGSKDEPAGKSGFAHLFEHMMFQETENRKGEYFTPLRAANALDINGNTTNDRTRYYELIQPGALDLALWLESDRMQYLLGAIDQKALDGQRAVVKNEKRQSETPAGAARSDAFLAAMYPAGHPYAHSVIGSMQDLDAASVDDVRRWFDSYYGASNAILLIAGDIDIATAKKKVAHYFGDVRPGEPIQRIAEWVPTLTEGKRLTFFDKQSDVRIERTWPVPSGTTKAAVLLEAFAASIWGTPESPLNKALVENGGPADQVMAMVTDGQVNSLFSVSVSLRPGADPADAERRLDAAMAEILRTGPSSIDLHRYLDAKAIGLTGSLEEPTYAGAVLEAGETAIGDPMFFKTVNRWEREATPQSVAATARQWLTRPSILTTTFPEPALGEAAAGSVDRAAMPAATPADVTLAFPPVERATLPGGTKIVVVRRPKVPMVNVAFEFDTGDTIARDYGPYVAGWTFGSLLEGSKRYPQGAIEAKMRDLAITPSAAAGNWRSTVEFSTTTGRLAEAMDFMAEVMREPQFPQRKVDEYLAQVDTSFDAYERNPAGALSMLFNKAVWGDDHPNGRITARDAARDLSREDMLRFYRNEVASSNMTAYFVGDITLERAKALVARNFGGWNAQARPAATTLPPPPAGRGARVILIDVPNAQQSHIFGGRLIGPWHPRRGLVEMIANGPIGGGFTARINMNLREDKGWTYGAYSRFGSSIRTPRAIYVDGAVQTEHTADAIREIIGEVRAYTTTRPITPDELDVEKRNLTAAFVPALATRDSVLEAMLDASNRGLPLDSIAQAPSTIRSVTLDEARAAARDMYRVDAFVWTISGDLKRIEADVRKLGLGEVEVQDVYGRRLR